MSTQPRVLKWSLIIGIVIVINLFFGYALSLIYKAPEYITYCPQTQVNIAPDNQAQCVANGGQWNEYPNQTGPKTVDGSAGYCDIQFTCNNSYQAAEKVYERNVFVTLMILGALLVLIGNFMKGNGVIASGLSLAGVLSFIIASARYWSYASDYLHVGILAIALALLLWIAYKKFKDA